VPPVPAPLAPVPAGDPAPVAPLGWVAGLPMAPLGCVAGLSVVLIPVPLALVVPVAVAPPPVSLTPPPLAPGELRSLAVRALVSLVPDAVPVCVPVVPVPEVVSFLSQPRNATPPTVKAAAANRATRLVMGFLRGHLGH